MAIESAENQAARQQMWDEIGEDELNPSVKFTLLQKYGLVSSKRRINNRGVVEPGFDRGINNPGWLEENLWKKAKQTWITLLKNAR